MRVMINRFIGATAAACAFSLSACAQETPEAEAAAPESAAAAAVDVPAEVAAAPADWREVAPGDLLRFDTSEGRILIEMAPEFAPRHVQRISRLAATDFYDGTVFHRVIDTFMAQGGDPWGSGAGGSDLQDLQAEFRARLELGEGLVNVGERPVNPRVNADVAQASYYNGFPIGHQPTELASMTGDGRVLAWILHCPGSTSMARTNDPNTANSQFFLMRGTSPHLDTQYTAWGRVVHGVDTVMALHVGEPPSEPSQLVRAEVMSDLPEAERDRAWVMRTDSEAFQTALSEERQAMGRAFDICDFSVPSVASLASSQ